VEDGNAADWQGLRSYRSFAAALADCEANVNRLLREEYGKR
jgi:hypothetical protein